MSWKMNCLLCEPGTKWHPARPKGATQNLMEIQEHLMNEHQFSRESLLYQTRTTISPGFLQFSIFDGQVWYLWLEAWKNE